MSDLKKYIDKRKKKYYDKIKIKNAIDGKSSLIFGLY